MKIGNRIAKLRRQQGMTQEQLAEVLGVSAPAVSKWETEHSCPDIAMLCPLARALGTNVDTLLAYEEFLSAEQVTEHITEIIEIRRAQGTAQAEALLGELPETPDDATGLWFNLYKKKGQTEKAEELLQKRMFVLSTQMMACLTTMIESTQTEKALKLCGIYRKLEEIIYVGGGSGDLLFAECYGRAGREREAADSLIAYLESHASTWPQTNPLLFEPTIKGNDSKKKPSKEMQTMMLSSILSDDTLSGICKREEVIRAIQSFAGEDSILL